MPVLTDAVIDALVRQEKKLPSGYRDVLLNKMKVIDVHSRSELRVTGEEGDNFLLILRQSKLNPFDFSVILAHEARETTGVFRLRRYNGRSHEHTNKIELNRFRSFHIHFATERYQAKGFAEDAYAEPTERYGDLYGAFNCMINDCGFILPPDENMVLF